MAIKAHVTFSQKLGQPDYGSVGVGCSLEIELDANLLERDPDEVRGQLGLAYLTCRHPCQALAGGREIVSRTTHLH